MSTYQLILLSVLTSLVCSPADATVIYVSPNGNDGNTGVGPGSTQAMRTIQAAVNKLHPGDTLLICEGIYRETVTFPHSGTADRPITLKPYDGQQVVISGCQPVTGWTRFRDNIWKAPMDWTLGSGRNQVFDDSGVMIEARFPDRPEPGLEMYVSDLSPLWPTFGHFSIPEPVKNPGRVVSKSLEGQPDNYWKGALYYGVHYQGWATQTGRITSSQSGEIQVDDRTRQWWFTGPYGKAYKPEEGRGMIVGHLHALDQPGEWHWQDNWLYVIPRADGKPGNIQAKRRQLAFDLSGRQHIHIRSLKIRAASLLLNGSAHCVVDGCDIAYVSHFTRHYATGQVEHGRNTITSGETGIFVSGHDNAFLNCSIRFSAGAGFYLRGYHHTIHNCLIDQISYTAHYLNAITDAVNDFIDYENFLVGGHVITYNTMCNAGRHFFNFYGNGTSRVSRDRAPMDYMATLFAHNHLYNGMLQTRDAGFITGYYASGGTLNGLNSQIIYNVLHDCYDIFGMRIHKLGIIYLDAGTCDVDLHHNLLWAAPGSHQRGLWYNTMCVDIHEHDNVFHEQFTLTCDELRAKDFPNGKPFRFGHDFQHPPDRLKWPQLEERRFQAEACTSRSANVTKSAGQIGGLRDGDWFSFDNVDFSHQWQSAVMRFSSAVKPMNTDRSARAQPRHQKVTDPLVMEAIRNDGMEARIRKQWTFLYHLTPGAWVRFRDVPLGRGYRRFRVVYGNDSTAPRWVEVHLDRVDGPLVGKVSLPQTDNPRNGRIQIYGEHMGEIAADAQGTHDVFLVFQSHDGNSVGEFEYFRFEQYRGQIALQKNEVKLELRADGPNGEKIGEFYPRFTGGTKSFRDFVAKFEPVQGAHALTVVVRSAIPGPIGNISWISLERATRPIDMTGIGTRPLIENGEMRLPKATNRPRSLPADKYVGRISGSRSPHFPADRLAAPPVLDGLVDPATANGRLMKLDESWDGSKSAATPSTAWIGYDNTALYITVNNPINSPRDLQIMNHQWGASDMVEIAVRNGYTDRPGATLKLDGWPDGHIARRMQPGESLGQIDRLSKTISYRASVGKNAWSCEWRLPFATCGFTPEQAPMLLLNIGVRKTAQDAWVFWRGTGSVTSILSRAGILIFPTELSSAKMLPKEQLAIWLDASDAPTIVKDGSGNVSLWKDKSGNGQDAHQPSPQYRPTYRPGGLNGMPALQFNENSRTRLELPDLAKEPISATVFVAFSNRRPGSEVNHNPRLFTASDGKAYDYKVGLCCSVPGKETGGPRLMTTTFSKRWAKDVRIGCFSPNYQTYFTGHISELLVYRRILTPDQQSQVQAYLASKWKLFDAPEKEH